MSKERIDARKYNWKRLDGLAQILGFLSGTEIDKPSLEITHVDYVLDADGNRFFNVYGNGSVSWINEAFRLTDSKIIACCTLSVFVDSNSSNESKVAYFGLTPKENT